MKKQAAALLSSEIAILLISSSKCQRNIALTMCWELDNYLFKKYASRHVISETNAEIMRLTQPPNMIPI